MAENNRIKIAGYAKRIFFNENIEYRNFSPDLVGLQLTSEGGTTLFTNGNFSIDVNLDPKPDVVFRQGTKSKLFSLDDIVVNPTEQDIQKNIKTNLNLDLTNPLTYVWYGSAKELIRSSLIQSQENFPAAIYVDNKVGSVTGNNITNYVYDISTDESTFTVNSRFFVNPYNIKYTLDSQYTPTEDTSNKLRNFTVNYSSYVIEHNGISKPIISITPATQNTNSDLEIVVKGNAFPELTGIYIPTLSFLFNNVDASIPYFIKPNETEIEGFFTSLNDFQKNILSRETNPKYNSIIISTEVTDDGLVLTTKETLQFPVLEDGYNLNFFDSLYITYLSKLTDIGESLDESRTDIIIRKYTTEAINSFDTLPSAGDEDLSINGEKATKLLRIYGVEFDEVKKFINGIKFAHVVTYDKKNNVPDSLVKDLSHMLGLDPVTFVTSTNFNKLLLPSNGAGEFSGTSVNYTQDQIDIELYRRLILNIAWLWKSKGTRKSIEFLFRFIGAPEALVNFDEYIVMVDKPLDMDKIKDLLYLYTGEVSEVDLNNIPYDDNGYPLPPTNGQLVITDFFDPETGQIVENEYTDMYFQKAGGWYRNTYGGSGLTVLRGNNPHVGPYDGGSEYLQYFSKCYIPNFNSEPTITVSANTQTQNYFVNYNYGIFNGIPTGTTEFFTSQLAYNSITGGYQPIDECVNVNYSIIETPLQNDGNTTLEQAFFVAEQEYLSFQAQIQQDSYLAYSPEWQTIQNNYELAQMNSLTEVSTENCGLNSNNDSGNNTLQICVEELVTDVLPFNCDTLSAVTDCSPFLYYVDPTNGQKVSFDEFSQCCTNYDNGQYEYVSYINSAGRKSEYCSASVPCVGDVNGVLPSGIVAFNVVGNNPPPNVYEVFDKSSGLLICVQFIGDATILADQMSQSSFFNGYPLTPQGYIDAYTDLAPPGTSFLSTDSIFNWLEVTCTPTTIISSPECCAWHGYDYQVVANSSPQETFYGTAGDNYIVCITNTNLVSSELITSSPQLSIPQINLSANTTYNEFSNPNGVVNGYYSTDVYRDCLNESLIVTGSEPGVNTFIPTPNSLFSSSTLNVVSNWEVSSIDQYGRISFTPIDPSNNFILDWNSQGDLGVLYQDVADYYGYEFGDFTIGCDNILTPYYGSGNYSTSTIVTSSAVDSSRIGCDDINNVSVVFGSENWSGFKLPEIVDCSCTVDFSFDYMLKYDVENLMECTGKDICYPTIFNEVSLDNIDCRNFIVFTDNEEDPTDPNSLINNFNSSSTPQEEYTIWQNNLCIVEPSSDCCNAIGGNVVSVNQWASTNQTWVDTINTEYVSLKNGGNNSQLSVDLTTFISGYTNTVNNLNDIIDGCYNLTIPNTDDCNIDYSEYVQTTNVCSLDVPLECGLWTKTLTDYRNLIDAVNDTITQFTGDCGNFSVNSPVIVERKTSDVALGRVKAIQNKNKLKTEKESELKTFSEEKVKLEVKILDIDNEIESKRNDDLVISQAITTISTNLDCGVYENKIREIDNFDYRTFCLSSTKNNQYTNCVRTQTLINEEQKLLYTDLLENCRLNNSLQPQLTKAKFDNNSELISVLQKQIFETETKIDTLTKEASKFIESDPSQQTSKLQTNNRVETINRTAELLGTTTDKITDSNGNLTLTTTQKTTLSIISTQNQSRISSLLVERGELQLLLNDTINKFSKVATNKNNGLGRTLLSWGGGLIGASLYLKGLLDPEITTGVITAAIWTMPHKLFADPTNFTGVGGGLGDVGGGALDLFLGECYSVILNGVLYSEVNPSNPSLADESNPIGQDCCSWESTGYPVVWDGDFCRLTPPSSNCEVDPNSSKETLFEDIVLSTPSNQIINPDTDLGIPGAAYLFGPFEGNLNDNNYYNTPYYELIPLSTVWNSQNNPNYPNGLPDYMVLTSDGEPLSEDCCSEEILGFPVAPYIMGLGNTGESGIQYQTYYFGCFCTADCTEDEDIVVVTPTGTTCPPVGDIDLVNGMLMDGVNQITLECCTNDNYSTVPDVAGLNVEPIYDTDGTTYLGCGAVEPSTIGTCCDTTIIQELFDTLELLQTAVSDIENQTQECYDNWLSELNDNYQDYLINEQQNYLKYLDDLKINFKLFVDNNNPNTNTNIDTDLTYLPYTQSINPIWEWDPTQQYSGVILSGSDIDIATIEQSIFDSLSTQNVNYSSEMFEPNWSTLNFTIPECVCSDLRRLYPNKEFYFSIEIENYECSVCLLVDNISVNVTDCKNERLLSLNECIIPQLSCVIDNKKSWVYTDKGVVTETICPEGECNTMSTNTYDITKLTTPEERLWTNLEYRYTNYDVNHSDLIINVKNTSFSIDPSKAIECDVFNFWKNIDCSDCPTSCTTGDTITFSGQVYTSTTLGDYTLDVSASTGGLIFSCDTYTSILTEQVLELKNDYYSLTADYNESLDANYNDLLNKGGSLSKFYIQKNNCGSDTIVINNNSELDNLFGLLTENSDGSLSFYESYIYSGSTPYVGGVSTEVISGITAQTFNQTTGMTLECCTTLNGLINDKGTLGLGVGKNYVWDTTTNSCNWKEINSCEGDCEYYGTKKVISREDCLSGITTGVTVGTCINPLDFLDVNPSEINIKDNFDSLVLSNLIDAKSRQTISDYPTLRLFYQLYLNASNCGEELSGKLTYNNLFQFMDEIGDYWLDLLEQVVPSTTIWEGCDNSGKIYRNTIFDQNKYNYKKYSLNYLPEAQNCELSGVTDFSIGSQSVYTVLQDIPIYPTNDLIVQTKNEILVTKVEISTTQQLIDGLNNQLCSLNLQDVDTPNLQSDIDSLNVQISGYNQTLTSTQETLSNLLVDLEQQQTDYLSQQENYYSNYTSCSGLTTSLVNAQNDLVNFIPGTTNYERQRNFIANIRSKLNKCVKQANQLVTNEDSVVYITQIYDTNEYEGNITIFGDDDWDSGGSFYNTELIHNCQ